MTVPLFLNHDAELDWLIALRYGLVDDGLPDDLRDGVIEDRFCFARERPDGPAVGFIVLAFSDFDADDEQARRIWQAPRFDAPVLGLRDATAGEIVVAARTFYGHTDSLNRLYFHAASVAKGEEAADLWRHCLECGDAMAHYGLGYTLVELGRPREAYPHLRAYSELVPANSWAWCWLGRAAEEMGDLNEAWSHYKRAVELERAGSYETDAPALIAGLEAGDPCSARTRELD